MMGVREGKEYQWTTVKEVANKAKNLAAGMEALGLVQESYAEGRTWKMVGLKSKNRPEWGLMHTANYHMGATTIALYDTLGPDATAYIIELTEIVTLGCSSDLIEATLKMKKAEQAGADRLKKLVNIVNFDNKTDSKVLDLAKELGVRIVGFDDVLEAGARNKDFKVTEPTPDDVYILSFTSGTTGYPKGVKFTHKACLGVLTAMQHTITPASAFNENDTYISYLPYSHIFEQILYAIVVVYGMKCGYYSGDVTKIVGEDIPALKPTFFPGVPRLYNRMYGSIQAKINAAAGCKGWLISNAL